MNIKKFTAWQLFSLTDGRVSTGIDDIYDIINHIFNTNSSTIGLTVLYTSLKLANPDWFQEEKDFLTEIGMNRNIPYDTFKDILEKRIVDVPGLESKKTAEDIFDRILNK